MTEQPVEDIDRSTWKEYEREWIGRRVSSDTDPDDRIPDGSGQVSEASMHRVDGHNLVYLRVLLDKGRLTVVPAGRCYKLP